MRKSGSRLPPSPLAKKASRFYAESVNTPEWRERIAALKPDLILSVYYRHMIGTKILALPPLGAFNMHGSLLPSYRGRAPINWRFFTANRASA